MEQNLDLGQHFMVDEALIERIITSAHISNTDSVLEIGLGTGILTKQILLQQPHEFVVIEKDERLTTSLPVQVQYADVLDVIEAYSFDKLIANLPYHILEPLFIKLLFIKPKQLFVVVSDSFAHLLLSKTILGTIYRHFYTISYIETISPSAFNPQPRVLSAFIILEKKDSILENEFRRQFYFAQTKKVKNYFEFITAQRYTKREIARTMESISEELLEKKLYMLSTEEFVLLDSFYETIMFKKKENGREV